MLFRLAHNKVQLFAHGGAGRQLRCRLCARRYIPA